MVRLKYYENGDNRVTLCDRGEECQTLLRYVTGGFIKGECVGTGYLFKSSAVQGFNALVRKADNAPSTGYRQV